MNGEYFRFPKGRQDYQLLYVIRGVMYYASTSNGREYNKRFSSLDKVFVYLSY